MKQLVINMSDSFNPKGDDCVSCPFISAGCSYKSPACCPIYNAKPLIQLVPTKDGIIANNPKWTGWDEASSLLLYTYLIEGK